MDNSQANCMTLHTVWYEFYNYKPKRKPYIVYRHKYLLKYIKYTRGSHSKPVIAASRKYKRKGMNRTKDCYTNIISTLFSIC